MEKKQIQVYWEYRGSFIVSVPNDKINEFKNNTRGYTSSPLINQEGYPSDFERMLKGMGGDFLEYNTEWDGEVTDMDELE